MEGIEADLILLHESAAVARDVAAKLFPTHAPDHEKAAAEHRYSAAQYRDLLAGGLEFGSDVILTVSPMPAANQQPESPLVEGNPVPVAGGSDDGDDIPL